MQLKTLFTIVYTEPGNSTSQKVVVAAEMMETALRNFRAEFNSHSVYPTIKMVKQGADPDIIGVYV